MPLPRVAITLATALCLACAGNTRWADAVPPARPPDAETIAADVAWLAADAREGRGLGTAGLEAAAVYLAEGFRAAGLTPGAADGSFFQRFEMPTGIEVATARLALDGAPLERGRDFEALLASEDFEGSLEVVFAGYGISDAESGWDDYAGLDVDGKAVVILDARPPGEQSRLAGVRGAGFLSRAYKLLNARRHGAAALLLVPSATDLEGLPGGAGAEALNPTVTSVGVAAFAVSREAAERIVAAAGGADLAARQTAIDARGGPASERLANVRIDLSVRVERERGDVRNVVAKLPGADPSVAHEAVVVGAHYDHLGQGSFGSLAPARRGEVHNGADDNASGTAGLLALARAFGAGPPPRRTLVLAAFTGEEAGLVGSAEYVQAPPVPIADTVAMINLDMIGRLAQGRVTVFGAESSPRFRDLVERAADGSGIQPSFELGATGPSDQTSFHAAEVPVLFFFTGTHPDYHSPDDDAEKVDAEGEARLLAVVERTARALLDAEQRPAFVRAPMSRPGGPAGGGYGPYLGTVPAFGGAPVAGVRLSGVSPGSPAERAGMRGGDVIVGFDGAPVRSLEEYAALLFASRAGRTVEIEVERDDRRMIVRATLGQRR